MKKILLLIGLVFGISCSNDDNNGSKLTITVEPINSLDVTISWSLEGGDGQTLYRIVFNDETIEDGYNGNQYTFSDIQNDTNYSGVVFAISENGDDTFANFNFTTKGDVWYGDLYIGSPYEADNFNFRVVTGVLNITLVEDMTKFTSLEQVGDIVLSRLPITSLSALGNISSFTNRFGTIAINNCPNLNDVTALSNLASSMSGIIIRDAPSLDNLNGLGMVNGGSLVLENTNISSLQVLNNVTQLNRLRLVDVPNITSLTELNIAGEMVDLTLSRLNLSNLNGLNSVVSIEHFEISSLEGISNLDGLDSWNSVHSINIFGCGQLSTLDGANLSSAFHLNDTRPRLWIRHNVNLTDLCGFKALAQDVDYGNFYHVNSNAYNPTEIQLESETECRQ